MNGNPGTKAPRHLWIVGVLAVLWNGIGAIDYAATQFRYQPYMSQFTPEQLAYFYGFPAWATSTWAIAVWSAVIASLGLLLRKSWAVALFGLSIAAMLVTAFYNFVLRDGLDMMGTGGALFTVVIWVVAFALFFYARRMAGRGVLR